MKRAFVLPLLLFAAVGCLSKRVSPPSPFLLRDPLRLIAAIEARNRRITALAANAQVRLETPRGKESFDENVLAALPARLRLETITFLGNTVGLVVTDGEILQIYVPRDRAIYEGDATPANLARVLPLTIEVDRITELLLTRIPLIERSGLALAFDEAQQRYRLRLSAPERVEQEILLDTDLNVREVRWIEGDRLFEAHYDGYKAIPVPFPMRVSFHEHQRKTTLAIHFYDVEINPEVSADLFTFTPPSDVRRVPLEATAPVDAKVRAAPSLL